LYFSFVFCIPSLAIAFLWIEFVREVRWCWEETQPLPKMPIDGSIDLSSCLINQKLHLVILYISLIGNFKLLVDTNNFFFVISLQFASKKNVKWMKSS